MGTTVVTIAVVVKSVKNMSRANPCFRYPQNSSQDVFHSPGKTQLAFRFRAIEFSSLNLKITSHHLGPGSIVEFTG